MIRNRIKHANGGILLIFTTIFSFCPTSVPFKVLTWYLINAGMRISDIGRKYGRIQNRPVVLM